MNTPVRVLAVDDDDDIQSLLKVALRKGFVLTSAMDGEEALDWMRRGEFDVILLDMNLPDMTGYDVLNTARRQRIQTPCILLTAENSSAANILFVSVSATAGMPSPAITPGSFFMRIAPSRSEYSECRRRWMNRADMRAPYLAAPHTPTTRILS